MRISRHPFCSATGRHVRPQRPSLPGTLRGSGSLHQVAPEEPVKEAVVPTDDLMRISQDLDDAFCVVPRGRMDPLDCIRNNRVLVAKGIGKQTRYNNSVGDFFVNPDAWATKHRQTPRPPTPDTREDSGPPPRRRHREAAHARPPQGATNCARSH